MQDVRSMEGLGVAVGIAALNSPGYSLNRSEQLEVKWKQLVLRQTKFLRGDCAGACRAVIARPRDEDVVMVREHRSMTYVQVTDSAYTNNTLEGLSASRLELCSYGEREHAVPNYLVPHWAHQCLIPPTAYLLRRWRTPRSDS